MINDTTTVYDTSTHCRHGDVHGALIRDGGDTRNYRHILQLNNDVRGTPDVDVNQYVDIRDGDSHIETDKATISFWIRPTGISRENSGIVFNNSTDGFTHGVMLSTNGNAYSLGYNWKNQRTSHNIDLKVYLPHDKWSFVVVLIYSTGIVRVFLDNVYVKYYDLGVKHEVVTFDNLEIGRFSGMIDDIRFYSDTLYYGKIGYEEHGQSHVRALYETSRVPSEEFKKTPPKQKRNELDFYYYQSLDFLDAHAAYSKYGGEYDSLEEQRKQQFILRFGKTGGPNETTRSYATDDFTAIAGIINPNFVEE